jgi:predicted DNA-binding ribbon-helix-helix protein
MKSPVVKRSIVIAGHKTSISLEDAFWKALKDIAIARRATLSDLVASIDAERQHGNLSSAIRLFVLDHYQSKSTGHVSGAVSATSTAAVGGAPANPAPREMMMVPPGPSPVLRPE